MIPRPRRGFALLAVLTVIVGAVALGAGLSLVSRDALASAWNRVALTRAAWIAEGCQERVRAAIDGALEDDPGSARAWQALDSVVHESPVVVGCHVALKPAGLTLDINADENGDVLRRVLFDAGIPVPHADSLVDALLDWRDPDDAQRAVGAERSWYAARRRATPRNGPLSSVAELRLVKGFETPLGVDSLFGVDSERVLLDRAPLAVIAALPGMTREAVAEVAQRRVRGAAIGDLASFAAALSPAARETLLANYQALVGQTTDTPDAWLASAHASGGSSAVIATLELRLARAGTRAAVVRRRSWP